MAWMRALARLPRYAWAAPGSLVGLAIAGIALLLGARARTVDGVLEVTGGRLAVSLSELPTRLSIVAFTLGHVIVAVSPAAMDSYRTHERVHVRQYERWGPLFPFLYWGSSLWQLLKGRDPYFGNCFEREAHRVAARGAVNPDQQA